MNTIKKIIKNILLEIFDNLDIPKEFKIIKNENDIIYKFIHKDIDYGIEFKIVKNKNINDIMIPDEKIKKIIFNTKNKYHIAFGVLINDTQVSDNMQTNKYEAIEVINNVNAIINDFINKNNVKVITYYATKKRDSIYKYIYDKHLKNNFFFYTAKETPFYDRFLIKKELIK